MLIGDCKLTTEYLLLLLDDGKAKEVGRELEWYWFLVGECLCLPLEDNRQDAIKIISKKETKFGLLLPY